MPIYESEHYKIGDIVKLKLEYSTAEEQKLVYRITNLNTYTNRAYITLLNSDLPIAPSELVDLNMIEKTV